MKSEIAAIEMSLWTFLKKSFRNSVYLIFIAALLTAVTFFIGLWINSPFATEILFSGLTIGTLLGILMVALVVPLADLVGAVSKLIYRRIAGFIASKRSEGARRKGKYVLSTARS